ncbi:MAG: hypothetical protein ABL993_00935 [Vicinamibacterales bacterium]
MPTVIYTIQRADGSTYEKEVQEPDAPAPAQEQPFVRAGAKPPAHPLIRALNPIGSMLSGSAVESGLGDFAIKSYVGLKNSLGLGNEDDKRALEQQKLEEQADPEPFKRGAGAFVGNVAATALPAAKTAGALAPVAARLGVLGAPATAAAVSAATEGLLAPGTVGEKASAAGEAALWGGGLQAAGSAVRKAGTGLFSATKEAMDLMAQKMYPTLAQAAAGRPGRFIGKLTSGIADVSSRQAKETEAAFIRRVLPGFEVPKDMHPDEVTAIVKDRLNKERDALLDGKTFTIGKKVATDLWDTARGPRGTQSEAQALATKAMSGVDELTDMKTRRIGRARFEEIRNKVQDAIDDFSRPSAGVNEHQARRNMISVKDKLDALVRDPALSKDELVKLRNLDDRYTDAKRYFSVTETAPGQKEVKPMSLLREYARQAPSGDNFSTAVRPMQREVLNPSVRVMENVNQDEARTALVAARRMLAPVGKAVAGGAVAGGALAGVAPVATVPMAAMYGLSALGQTKPGARALLGDYPKQQQAAEFLRKMFPYTTALGSAVEEN